ncbi:hypothetical protein NEMIN01_0254 [Nematocida minor]|uniref:uncharacterized protein n=1 Tax=Nematocida minor TaxID=1912983 RepID=UPI00221F1B6A|nr:uncharacterized protein NEMIN01_0254 [Nematocida minor]KAI5188990.1 hypothetical protein NEMIN01_0254 [Nematocida minor]
MKNQKLLKILAGTARVLFLAKCRGSRASFEEDETEVFLGLSVVDNGKIDNSAGYSKSYTNRAMEGISQHYGAFVQHIERPSVIRHTSDCFVGSSRQSAGEKRKESEMSSPTDVPDHQAAPENKKQRNDEVSRDGSLDSLSDVDIEIISEDDQAAPENKKQRNDEVSRDGLPDSLSNVDIEIIPEDEQPATESNPVPQPAAEVAEEEDYINLHNIDMWNDMDVRLVNKRRKGYRVRHKTIYVIDDLADFKNKEIKREEYKEGLRESIEEYATRIAPLIQINPMWHYIASKSTTIQTKYKDLLGLQELLRSGKKADRKMIESIQGYRPNIIEDIIEYIEKNQPMRAKRYDPENAWRETLGDIYMRTLPLLNYAMLKDLNGIDLIGERYHALVYALRMVLVLPEVRQDFLGITGSLIKRTRISENFAVNTNYQKVLLIIHRMVQLNIDQEIDENLCEEAYSYIKLLYKGRKPLGELKPAEMYRVVYTILGKFYEKVKVIDTENEYVLAGKCIITNQKYVKCAKAVNVSGEEDTKLPAPTYTAVENKWNVSPDVEPHYHVYYVDNTTQQLRILCMPLHIDKKENIYCLHTIGEIVKHIKALYGMDACSDVIHPFKVKKGSREWSYIREKERDKTIKDLEECEVVFYYIEENIEKTKFTFVEFRPLSAHEKNSVCIPLFLKPLMQSAVEFGPFKKKEEHTEIDSIVFTNRAPDVYEYDRKYKRRNYSHLHNYYSNLYILSNKEKNADCYSMDCKMNEKSNGTVEAVWYVRMPSSIDEYAFYMVDEAFSRKENAEDYDAFIDTLESREYNKDNEMQGFWLCNNSAEAGNGRYTEQVYKMCSWLVSNSYYNRSVSKDSLAEINRKIGKAEKMYKEIAYKQVKNKRRSNESVYEKKLSNNLLSVKKYKEKSTLAVLYREKYIKDSKRPSSRAEFIAVRNVNDSKSHLGIHNEVLNTLISCYKPRSFVENK